MATYTIKITMSQDTVTDLTSFSLFGFKAVQTTVAGGAPVVWFQTGDFGLSTTVQWQEQYQAYTTQQEITNGVGVGAISAQDIDLGQTLVVTGPKGTGGVQGNGVAGAISISNATTIQFTCGISQQQGGNSPTPLCAFPLFGGGLDIIAPIEKVLLTFATGTFNNGTVIEKAFAPSFLIDLTGADNNTREVNFDMNLGWSNGGAAWGTPVAASDDLLPLLIDASPSAVQQLTRKAA